LPGEKEKGHERARVSSGRGRFGEYDDGTDTKIDSKQRRSGNAEHGWRIEKRQTGRNFHHYGRGEAFRKAGKEGKGGNR